MCDIYLFRNSPPVRKLKSRDEPQFKGEVFKKRESKSCDDTKVKFATVDEKEAVYFGGTKSNYEITESRIKTFKNEEILMNADDGRALCL